MANPQGINQYTKGGRTGVGSTFKPKSAGARVNIGGAAQVLARRGITLGAGSFNMKTKSTSYTVMDRSGKRTTLSAAHIKRLIGK